MVWLQAASLLFWIAEPQVNLCASTKGHLVFMGESAWSEANVSFGSSVPFFTVRRQA